MSSAEERLRQVVDGIAAAAKVARRDPADVRLIAVGKTRTADEIEDLIAAGLNDARAKADQAANAEMQKVTSGLPLPPGIKLPF